ncbi:leucine--tRNA ligase [Kaistella antarctica]|uniref:Leucine--tRNA ligase n=1 Tax=Kaistella antarctica TaxID=266748 RepID=A0A3S5EUU3_9FLAO|nr:class I tRNA ligase family protein [Kaistella antarctica]KEY17735.1 leucyl-tRNA synthetase [Kaistella antarctica]SEV79549.1 leucyl-tRNA synthetase [Kaistella antarctica]VEH99848.1 Leucine--tRNA ligase [Kaistella antarctica]
MFYDHQSIEKKWQKFWEENQTYKTSNATDKPKFYVLDMFPYPSGAGLHVGHPLGYIASDIYARYKRHQGFNVLHPIGYDSFGLPAEQYAIQTGQHPAVTTEENITRYEQQMRRIGFSFDWSREVRTSDASYYKWTQWIFIQLFDSWYNQSTDKAEPISELIKHFETHGTQNLSAVQNDPLSFTSEDWKNASELDQQDILLNYRLAYRAETTVNWCPGLGTVLANDEVKDGKSERGGYPVFQKKMMQWSMRITAYSERLLQGLNNLDWPQPLKDAQEYWIGKSQGALVTFDVEDSAEKISVFTTRPDTIFGATFMVLAPENPLVKTLTIEGQQEEVENYIEQTSKKTERDRMSDVKNVSGAFTGSYALNPFTNKEMPIYISDYVLMGYGTGAVMAVPAHDERDHRFAKKFDLSIVNVIENDNDIQEESFDSKVSLCVNSEFLNGLKYDDAKTLIISEIEKRNIGHGTTNYRQRDAIFSRQRYWGEPVPVYYKQGMPYTLPIAALPLELPEVEKYLPTEDGDPPLGNAQNFAWDEANQKVVSTKLINNDTVFPLELSTMPGWAGSSWYFLRYMDPNNEEVLADKNLSDYWGQVDLYIGGSEHATGHLLYARFWNMFIKDRGYINHEEPFKKLINQGMILGMSAHVYQSNSTEVILEDGTTTEIFGKLVVVSEDLIENDKKYLYSELPTEIQKVFGDQKPSALSFYVTFVKKSIDISLLINSSNAVNTLALRDWRAEFKDAVYVKNVDGKLLSEREVEKMSKSKYNVVNPDDICDEFGADCLRLYEMFLGPLEQSKPWNTQGLSGVYGFLKKLYNLYFNGDDFEVSDEEPTKQEYKILHTLIKKVVFDIDHFSFNTSVSQFMIAVNELQKLKTNKRAILEPLAIIVSPYAPHIAEELWSRLGHADSIEFSPFPKFEEKYLVEDEIDYPVSFNGKMRFKLSLSASLSIPEIQEIVLAEERTREQLQGNIPKNVIIVPKKIINIVL